MTRQEAIKILDRYDLNFCDIDGNPIPPQDLAEAFEMAIEVLEQENRMTRHEAIETLTASDYFWLRPSEDEAEALNMAIAALEQEQKRGKWEDMMTELSASFGRHLFVCSECDYAANYFVGGSEEWWDTRKPNYCPNCGARMESDEE